MQNTAVIILAGGKGTRMESDLPKALTPFKGQPFISHVLHTLSRVGVLQKPIITVGYQKERVMGFLGNENYIFAVQEQQLGTGHAVQMAVPYLDESVQTVVVLYADHPLIAEDTIRGLIAKQKETGAVVVMGTATLPDFEGWRSGFYKNFSRIIRDADGRPVRSVEFRDTTDEEKKITEVNPCYFAFDPKWMRTALGRLENKNTQGEYFLTDLLKMAFDEGKRIETIAIDPKEALGANSKAELAILESL